VHKYLDWGRSSPSATLARYIPAVAVTDVSQRLVDAIYAAYGRHPGRRAAHAKGLCAEGVFVAPPGAASISRAAHLKGDPVPVTIRFSNGSGDPGRPDTALDGRGMAAKFRLPVGELDLVAMSQPVFFVRDVESFIEMTSIRSDRDRLEEWVGRHPEALPAFMHLMTTPAPASYLDVTYHGIHAFRLVDRAGNGRYARYRWVPEAPGRPLASDERKAKPPDYLQEELGERLAQAPATFLLEFQLAAEGDPVDDPTVMWPDEREVIRAGHLTVERLVTDQAGHCERLVFDPLHLVDGIEPSADPILLARPGAYSVSIAERLGA